MAARTMAAAIQYALERVYARLNKIESSETWPNADADKVVTFANLPTGFQGQRRFCSNCRKQGEGAGAGTGTTVYNDGAAWRRNCDDATASA